MNRTGQIWKARNYLNSQLTLCVVIGCNEKFITKSWLLKSLEDPELPIFTLFETHFKFVEEYGYDSSGFNWIMKF